MADADSEHDVTPPEIPPTLPKAPASERPDPQATVRDCGGSGSTPMPVDASSWVPSFYRTKIGVRVIPDIPLISRSVWASGPLAQAGQGSVTAHQADKDLSVAGIRQALLLPERPKGAAPGEYSNAVNADSLMQSFIEPSSGVLTYFEGWGAHEIVHSIVEPSRTAAASHVDSDLFVRGIVPGRFIAYQMSVVLPSICAVGALGDAMKRKAFLTDATHARGVFEAATLATVQKTLIENGAKIYLRVLANKQSAALTSLFGSTECSTADLTACKKLLDDLSALKSQVAGVTSRSTVSALEEGTDPVWTTVEILAAPVSILAD